MHWAFDRTDLWRAGASAPGGASPKDRTARHAVALVASGAREECALASGELKALAEKELGRLFPAARRRRPRSSLVVKERSATVSPAAGWDALRPGTMTASSRLFLAGDWTATGLPPTIEGAVQSGHDAARAALACLGG
jgi:uncharacterized protein with NAD-binding domain and iron-sulfur cluster